MTAPLVSVVIPNHNYARFLPLAIDSVLAQTYIHREIIVIDDGSSDDSAAVVRRYGDAVRFIEQSNQGVSVARNRGIAESHGELLAFLDADDVYRPRKLEQQVAALGGSAAVVYTGIEYIDTEGRPLGTRCPVYRGNILREMALFRGPGSLAGGSTLLARKSCFERVGGFDPALSTSADWDMVRRLVSQFEIEVVAEPLVGYRLHGSGMHRNLDLFTRDMLHAFAAMFADPAARAIHHLRRRCYANLYVTFSGSYFHASQPKEAFRYALRSLLAHPASLPTHLAGAPLRRVRRKLSLGNDEPTI